MRIAFYSPLPPERSGIADYSYELLEELRHHLDVLAVVRDDLVATDVAPEGVEVVGFSSVRPDDVDCDVYQMGNNPRYHRFLFQRALDRPGLLVLHDPSLADFHAEMCRYVDSGVFRSEIAYDNPALGLNAELPVVDVGRGVRDLDRLEVLLVRRLVSSSLRTLVHSSAVASVLKDRYGADVHTIQLPAPVIQVAPRTNDGGIVFGVFGGINYYKRIEAVVTAFRTLHEEHPRARLVIAGRPDDRAMTKQLRTLSSSAELGGCLEVKTELSLEELEAEMVACDVAISLRWPTAGEMSATLMRAFGAGRPAIVTDVLQFREIDERYCWRVPVGEGEEAALLALMRRAVADPAMCARAGELAQRFVASEATYKAVSERYVGHVAACIERRPGRLLSAAAQALDAHKVLGVNLLDNFRPKSDGSDALSRTAAALRASGVDVVDVERPRRRRGASEDGETVRRAPEEKVPGTGRRRSPRRSESEASLPSDSMKSDPKSAASAFRARGRVTTPLARVEHLHDIDLCVADARRAVPLGEMLRRRHRRGRRTVTLLAPETLPLSRSFTRLLRHSDEIWVPSSFAADLVAGEESAPVIVVPSPLASRLAASGTARVAPMPLSQTFSVLVVADAAHGLAMANPWAAIAAYAKALPRDERGRAELTVVVRHLDDLEGARSRLRDELGEVAGSLVEEEDGELVAARVASCDVFVSLHRSTAFGLWCAEAMAAAKPVVATAFGGNLEYMTASTACLVGYEARRVSEGDFYLDREGEWGFEPGQTFAEPDLEQAASWLRRLAAHPDLRQRIGAAGRAAVEQHCDPARIGALMRARLESLEHRSPRDRDKALERDRPSRLFEKPNTGALPSLGDPSVTNQPATSTPWERATAAAGLSVPLGPGTRFRFVRRIFDRLNRPSLARQVEFNEAVIASLLEVRNELAEQIHAVRRAAVVALVDEKGQPVTLEEELLRLRRAVDVAAPIIQHQGWAIDAMREVIDDQLLDRELVSQEIDVARQQAFARFHDGLGLFRSEISELARNLAEQNEATSRRLERAERALTSARLRLAALDPSDTSATAPAVAPHDGTGADALAAVAPFAENPIDRFGALYASFEDRFRGSEGLIKERVGGYLEDVAPLKGRGLVLDVGCGRGDWLELLQENGIDAYGIEVSTGYAPHWKLNELDVRVADVRDHLAGVQPESLAAITALQVVEHITTEELLEFLELSFAALQPEGLLVLETPNPENLSVGADTFYLDPTHDRPIPAQLLSFLVESRGFIDVETRYLRRPELHGLPEIPPDAPWYEDLRPVRDVVDRAVFGAQDYAVVARRP